MGDDRRRFLKLAGLAVLAAGGAPVLTSWAQQHAPGPGQGPTKRLGMVIDVRRCEKEEGCTLCVDACHRAHNVPDLGNPKDEVKWIWKEKFEHGFPNEENPYVPAEISGRVPVFCNHCDNPPCVRVCPTKATWKRDDGVVMMDWHRCIGCRYCVVGCPYGSRSFNWKNPRQYLKQQNPGFPTRTKGVVEKCTLCDERLAAGLLPACVDACKVKALVFGDLADPESEVRQLLKSRFAIRRKPELGTHPELFYLV
jgi:Fe-S-cluster-containing dehydrogenase component